MSFKESQEKAEKWTQSSNFHLAERLESENKLLFKSEDCDALGFWVTIPEESKEWKVVSEFGYPSIISKLEDIAFVGCQSITDVLDKVKESFKGFVHDSDEEENDEDGDDDEFVDDYYMEDDVDAMQDTEVKMPDDDERTDAEKFFTGSGSSTAVHRLFSDVKSLKKSNGKFGVEGVPRGDNLFVWDVKLTDFPKDTLLGQDLKEYARSYKEEPVVSMEMTFPKDYPMNPPFVRILKPRFKFLTGHVTIGGSLCMEVLTRSGWCPTMDIEAILVQVRSEILSDKNTRLDKHQTNIPYSAHDAKTAFDRMVAKYGWK